VGTPKFPGVVVGLAKETYVGDEAQAKRGILSLRYPLSNGVVTDWAGAETLWAHALTNELRVDPRERSLVLSEAPQNPREHRTRMAEIFFEKFGVRSLYIGVQAVLALYASNATTGTVLDVGDGVSHVVPVYEGFVLPHAIQRLDLAGRDVTRTLASLLRETGTQLSSTAEFEVAREMKERVGFVRPSGTATPSRQQLYTLPDGKVVEVGDQAWRCAEILFTPATVGKDEPGIGRLVTRAVERCDVDVRRPLYSNIVLSGGTTLMSGFAERLQAELPSHARVVSPPTRRVSVWCGGSIVGSLSTFEEMAVSRAEFAEEGAAVLRRRFI
jgi:actin-related protein